LPVALPAAGATEVTRTPDPEAALTRREVALRSTATVGLAGIALVQAIELPSLFAQEGQFAALSMAAIALCIGSGLALTMAPAAAAGPLWRLVAAAAVVLLTGWALPHAFALPGLEEDGYGGLAAVGALDRWASPPGAVCAGLAIVSLLVAGIARRPARPAARALATALAVLATVGPGVWVGLVALGPGAVGGEQSLAAGHVHSHAGHSAAAVPEAIEFRPGSGRAGGHFLVAVTPPARHTALGLGLVIATVLVFTAGAVGHLRRRSAPTVPSGFEGGRG
jgi:hypothetical protein